VVHHPPKCQDLSASTQAAKRVEQQRKHRAPDKRHSTLTVHGDVPLSEFKRKVSQPHSFLLGNIVTGQRLGASSVEIYSAGHPLELRQGYNLSESLRVCFIKTRYTGLQARRSRVRFPMGSLELLN